VIARAPAREHGGGQRVLTDRDEHRIGAASIAGIALPLN
jgi:hypothetical protein